MDHLDHLHLLSNVQHGFRKERSCETQLSAVIQDIAYSLGLSQQVDAIILDFSRHSTLCHTIACFISWTSMVFEVIPYNESEISYQTVVSHLFWTGSHLTR